MGHMSINTDYSYNNSYYIQQAAKKQKLSLASLIDSNKDKSLSTDELSDFSAEINAKTGGTSDLSSVISKYTVNDVTGSHLAPEEWFAKIDEEKAAAETVQYEA
jgi:hypothetical protein